MTKVLGDCDGRAKTAILERALSCTKGDSQVVSVWHAVQHLSLQCHARPCAAPDHYTPSSGRVSFCFLGLPETLFLS